MQRLIHIRTEHLGPDEILVAAKVELDTALTFTELAAAIDGVEVRIRDAVPTVRLIYIEPDVHRDSVDRVSPQHVDDGSATRGSTRPLGLLAVLGAIVSFSISYTLVKWAHTPGSVIAFWRMIGRRRVVVDHPRRLACPHRRSVPHRRDVEARCSSRRSSSAPTSRSSSPP